MFKKIKKWHVWLIFGITLLIAVGLIALTLNYEGDRNWIIVLIVIDFIIMTFAMHSGISMTFQYKAKPKKYPTKAFKYDVDLAMDNLLQNKFKENKVPYGSIFMKIEGDVAYRVTIVTNADIYLEPTEQNSKKEPNKQLEKCTKFIGIELFRDYEDKENKIMKSLPDFSFQGKNIYYEGFYFDKETDTLHEVNVIQVDPEFSPYVDKLKTEYLLINEEI